MNGTSMSSPNAAGCIALIVSAAKDSNIAVTPTRVRRAVEQSAAVCKDVHVLGQGNGLIQVCNAWEYLQGLSADPYADLPITIKINSERFTRGIYLRQPVETSIATNYAVTLAPQFREDATTDSQFQFEMRLRLVATSSWVKCPSNVLLLQDGKTFNVFVDPRSLPMGVNVEFIEVYNESLPSNHALILKIPITVVKPEAVEVGQQSFDMGNITLRSGDRYRRFFAPPHGCTFVDIHVKDLRPRATLCMNASVSDSEIAASPSKTAGTPAPGSDGRPSPGRNGCTDNGPRTIALHAVQLFMGTPYRDNEHDKYLTLQPSSEFVTSWAVAEEVTMEVVLAPLWNSIGDSEFSAVVYFRGVVPVPRNISLTGGEVGFPFQYLMFGIILCYYC
jgi:tripeptidyl-peptidase-2